MLPSGPDYDNVPLSNRVCSTISAVAGETTIDGGAYIRQALDFDPSHKWRNVGIIFAFWAALTYETITLITLGQVLMFILYEQIHLRLLQ